MPADSGEPCHAQWTGAEDAPDTGGGGVRGVYPLDEALGLEPRERLTRGVRERSLWAVGEVSEEKAGAFWEKLAWLAVSRKKIHQLAWEEGDRLLLYWSINTLQPGGGLLFRNTVFEKGAFLMHFCKNP